MKCPRLALRKAYSLPSGGVLISIPFIRLINQAISSTTVIAIFHILFPLKGLLANVHFTRYEMMEHPLQLYPQY